MPIEWISPGDTRDNLPYLPLVRIQGAHAHGGIITCTELWGVLTHYYQGRTQPCLGDECEACEARKAKRYEGYLSIWNTAALRHELIAITPSAAEQIKDQSRGKPSLRGMGITLKRRRGTKSSMLMVQLSDLTQLPTNLPPVPPITKLLYKIWRYVEPAPIADAPPHVKAAATMLKNYHRQTSSASDAPEQKTDG